MVVKIDGLELMGSTRRGREVAVADESGKARWGKWRCPFVPGLWYNVLPTQTRFECLRFNGDNVLKV